MPKHFTAVIIINETVPPEPASSSRPGYNQSPPPVTERKVNEIVHMTIRAGSLNQLITKTRAHLDLVDEGDES